MNRTRTLIGSILTVSLVMGHIPVTEAQNATGNKYPVLGPCTRDDDAYKNVDFIQKPFEEWAAIYHGTVDRVITENLSSGDLQCSATTYQGLLTPSTSLKALAQTLPPWYDQRDFEKLKQTDFGLVLLEYLRVYECSLAEYSFFAAPEIIREEFRNNGATNAVLNLFQTDLAGKIVDRGVLAALELNTARTTLYKTLDFVSSYNRLRPLEGELECLQSTSLDLRNILALGAETSACLPRIWSAKDPLRDLPSNP